MPELCKHCRWHFVSSFDHYCGRPVYRDAQDLIDGCESEPLDTLCSVERNSVRADACGLCAQYFFQSWHSWFANRLKRFIAHVQKAG